MTGKMRTKSQILKIGEGVPAVGAVNQNMTRGTAALKESVFGLISNQLVGIAQLAKITVPMDILPTLSMQPVSMLLLGIV